jgi:hypothetical protein
MMDHVRTYKLHHIPTLLLLALLLTTCTKEEMMVIDNSLQLLSASIDGEKAEDGVTGIAINPSLELIFSHTLNTGALEAALRFTGGSGDVDYAIAYSNTNSTLTITPNNALGYETTYTLSLPAGDYADGADPLREEVSLTFTTAPYVPPNVTLESDVPSFSEDGGMATVTVRLSQMVEQPVTVELAFGGEATEGADYTASAMMVNLAPGETSADIELNSVQDGAVEGAETIEISISNVVNAEELTPQLLTLTLFDDDIDSNGDGFPDQGFIINEVLFDPPGGDAGDANGDGTRSASEDEFIEFLNDSDVEVDLSGFTLYDTDQLGTGEPRHTFPDGTIVPPGGVYVLFGGGNPSGDFGGAQVATTTTGNMNLNNADDAITIFDAEGNIFLTFDTQVEGAGINFGADQSVTRSPDINGSFALHTDANPDLLFSPGKKADGSALSYAASTGVGFVINEVLFDPPGGDPGDANGDGTRSASEDEFIEFVNDSNQPVDLSGFTLYDADQLGTGEPRHTFPDGTIVPPGGVYVLFGGGNPTGDFGGAQVGVSTTGNMNLNNADDTITIFDTDGNIFLTFDTQVEGAGISFGDDQSVTRSPDLEGGFTLHTTANPGLLFSPGTKTDGSPF